MKKAPLVVEPERIDDPVKWLQSSLGQLANFKPVRGAKSFTAGEKQLLHLEHALLPATRIVSVFLDEIGVEQRATEPISYILEALKCAASGRSHELFKIKMGRRKLPDPKSIWFDRLPIACLAAALKEVEPKTKPFDRVYDELKVEIAALKSKGNPRKGKRTRPSRVIEGWIAVLEGTRTTQGIKTWEEMSGLRAFYTRRLKSDVKKYKRLNSSARERWFHENVAAIRDDLGS